MWPSCSPWCYVGKRRLEAAISAFKGRPEGKDVDFNITWKPFQLNPDAPQDDPGKQGTSTSVQGIMPAEIDRALDGLQKGIELPLQTEDW